MANKRGRQQSGWIPDRGGAWNFYGGGKAHAGTLRRLGFDCVKKTDHARWMRRPGQNEKISVPCQPLLSASTVKAIIASAGVSRAQYAAAWNDKIPPKCPPASEAGAASLGMPQ